MLLGSSKWRRVAGSDVLAALRVQRDALGPKASRARLAIFVREGFSDELRQKADGEDVLLVTAADLFS